MEVAEIPKLDLSSSSSEDLESEDKKMGTQKISVSESEQINAYEYTAEEADSFVIDMDSFSPRIINKDAITNANSRITLQRSLSRKGSQRGVDRKVNGNVTLYDRDTVPSTCSPKASLIGSNTPEKTAVVAVGSTNHSSNTQLHHQITITAGNICTTTTESKSIPRRYSFRRPSSWLLDPKRLLLWSGCWFWRYNMKKHPYSWEDASYLTQRSLGIPHDRWINIDEATKEDLLLRRLWEKSNMWRAIWQICEKNQSSEDSCF